MLHSMENATTFGMQAEVYSSARPTYPSGLFDWIAEQAPNQLLAWDVGTGSGQAALQLAERFSKVHATDIDASQLAQAPHDKSICYLESPAHVSQLPDNSVDAITVATALHWFDTDQFWPEVRRVVRDGAIFCAWTYHSAVTHRDIQAALIEPLAEILEPYWSDGNRITGEATQRTS